MSEEPLDPAAQVPPGYTLSVETDAMDRDAVWRYLSQEAYWGRQRSRADVDAQLTGAWRNVGVFDQDGRQVAYARVVSDGVALAYLADVFVLAGHRGRGIGHLVVAAAMAGEGRRFRWLLHTNPQTVDFYTEHGFGESALVVLERPAGE